MGGAHLACARNFTKETLLDLKEIKELIALMKKNELSTFKMEKEGFKITLKKGTDFQPVITAMPAAASAQAPLPAALAPALEAPKAAAAAETFKEIVSPMVGTFYESPSPDAGPFVQVGQEVTEDTVVCIIEAMKVMNEIKAEVRGTIVERVAENGKPVQFGQALFKIK